MCLLASNRAWQRPGRSKRRSTLSYVPHLHLYLHRCIWAIVVSRGRRPVEGGYLAKDTHETNRVHDQNNWVLLFIRIVSKKVRIFISHWKRRQNVGYLRWIVHYSSQKMHTSTIHYFSLCPYKMNSATKPRMNINRVDVIWNRIGLI